jgi:hypothetical protein
VDPECASASVHLLTAAAEVCNFLIVTVMDRASRERSVKLALLVSSGTA